MWSNLRYGASSALEPWLCLYRLLNYCEQQVMDDEAYLKVVIIQFKGIITL